jgi:hypothetical protein
MKKVRTTDFCNCQPLEKRNPPATLLLFSGSFVPQKPRGSDTFSAGAGAAAGVLSFSLSLSLSLIGGLGLSCRACKWRACEHRRRA